MEENLSDIVTGMNMDETEDEEVKRNCYGMKHYESSSDDGETSDCDFVSSGFPIKFSCEKPRGVFLKPTPMPSKGIDRGCYDTKEFHHSTHNECNNEFSNDEDSESDDEYASDMSSNLQQENEEVEKSNFGDSSSETSCDASDEGSVNGNESEYDDDSSLASNSSTSGSDDGSSSDEETDEEGEDHEEGGVILDLDLTKVYTSPGAMSNLSESLSSADSVSAEEIQNFIEKAETSDMCFSDTEVNNETGDQTDSGDDYDVMKCLIDPSHEIETSSIQPLKRVLSNHAAMHVSPENGSQTKRSCRRSSCVDDGDIPPFLPKLSIGSSASCIPLMHRQVGSPQFSSSSDEEAVDSQLAEELVDIPFINVKSIDRKGPVPLLTPPASPIFPCSGADKVGLCEWPSNLAVDNALTAAIALRSLSPCSLVRLEEDNPSMDSLLTTPQTYFQQKRLRSVSEASNTLLTPMLEGMGMTEALKK